MSDQKVVCNYCDWKGEENDLVLGKAIDKTDEPEEDDHICPHCMRAGCLMDI